MSYESLKAEALGWWECQSGGGNGTSIVDSSGTKNGYLDGAVTVPTTTGPNANLPLALDFTGRNSWVRFDYPFDCYIYGSAQRAYGGWGKSTNASIKTLFTCGYYQGGPTGQVFEFRVDVDAGLIEIQLGGHVVRASATIAIDEWHHYMAVVPSGASLTSDVKAYVDGAEVTLTTYSGSAQTLGTDFGAYAGFGGAGLAKFDGPVAGFASFNRALTDEEVAILGGGSGGGGGGGGSAVRARRSLGLGGNLGLLRK